MKDLSPQSLGQIRMTKKERENRKALARAPRPKIASTIVLTHGPKENPRILMGQRSSKHDFMPSVYVFPGGRVDRGDSYIDYEDDLSPRTQAIMEAAYSPRKARAVVLASVRETYEETSLLLGKPSQVIRNHRDPSWDAFREAGLKPSLDGIEVFGRAITPPHRHKRFDAWFFLKALDTPDLPKIEDSAELLNVGWFTFDEIWKLELQRATQMMLKVLQQFMAYDRPPAHIFYSHAKYGKFLTDTFPSR
ncbi:NUDIX hydrolase [Hellea balneolensis]|uniref:NUDIX hydrolase n=1 Tax=Hellea balneolensis TaxID=287478 RepID=UPI00040B288E|nr:NUDIX hydrolase [Hellea balneolensis]